MLLTLCLILHCSSPDSPGIYSGRARQLEVRIPRVQADIVVDGDLGDSAWAHAALLTGFSQYAPNDGVSAVDSTQVLVWYSSNAIYFGIRAYELHAGPSATFIGQSGNLVGLAEMHRGLVVDLNPEATAKATGARGASGYAYDTGNPQVGGNVRWGVTDNLTLNGTIKPDFSQVESDAGQLAFDPRQALFFPEQRPFFLEGSELFQVPQNLIYTRRIVQPIAAGELSRNTHGTHLCFLSRGAHQNPPRSGTDNPIFNILRAQHSLGHGSRIGVAYTDRIERDSYNRVADIDGRLVFKEIYGLSFQLAGSRTRSGGVTTTAPLWISQLTIQHRVCGLRSVFAWISDQIRTSSGFIGRHAIVHSYVDPSFTTYGKPGALLQRFTGDILVDGIWQYQNFIHGRRIQDQKLHFNVNTSLRGGGNVGAG